MTAWFRTMRAGPVLQREAIDDLARSLALCADPETLRASIGRRVTELVGCSHTIVCYYREAAGLFSEDSSHRSAAAGRVTFAADGTLCRWLRTNQEPLLVPHPRGAFAYLDEDERSILLGARARACVPIFAGAQLVAILLICSHDDGWRLARGDVDLAMRLGQQAGLALENAELHLLERDRLRGLHQAQQLAVAGQLATTVAHEVRNPLAIIRSTVQYVLGSSVDWDQKRQRLEQVLEEVDRIERTVSGVLALSRQPIEFSDIDLTRTVEEALLLIQAYAGSRGLAIEREFDAGEVPVLGDPRALHQVCLNLLLNACDATAKGGHLTVQCGLWHPAPDAKPLARLCIADTGTGIPAEHLPHVFDPFFTTKRDGSGLGLPISLDIVARHGGTLRLDSEAGRGTAIVVLIPLRAADHGSSATD